SPPPPHPPPSRRTRAVAAHVTATIPPARVYEFAERIGNQVQRRDPARRALHHKSYSHESKDDGVRHNETFEFLGDSVLGFIIGDLLFQHFPHLDEGALSKMKAYLVSAPSLAEKARQYAI